MNAASAASEDAPATTGKATAAITPQMKTVMDYLAEYGENDRRRSAGTAERQKDESLPARPPDERKWIDRNYRQRRG